MSYQEFTRRLRRDYPEKEIGREIKRGERLRFATSRAHNLT